MKKKKGRSMLQNYKEKVNEKGSFRCETYDNKL